MRFEAHIDISKLGRKLSRIDREIRYATQLALSDVARQASLNMGPHLERALDRPTGFTKRGFRSEGARGKGRDRLFAIVAMKDGTARYLAPLITGGVKYRAARTYKLPGQIRLNAYGNIPRRAIPDLIKQARGERVGKRSARRKTSGVSSKVSLFYGEPGDGRPAGVYKRVSIGSARTRLIPIVTFTTDTITTRPLFDFHRAVSLEVSKRWPLAFQRALSRALSK